MGIEICTLGGYNEVGRNSTVIKVDDEVVILDLGIHLESYIKYTKDEDIIKVSGKDLIKVGAVPDISKIKKWQSQVIAIIPSHAHLDHIGAIPYLSNHFNADIFCTPFTAAVIKEILKNENLKIHNKIIPLNEDTTYKLSENIKVEFIHITHSTPQSVMVALHTKYGIILYANDYKFDLYPTLGKTPNFERLKELGQKGILALICESTYASDQRKTPSESVAKDMLRDVLLGTNSKGKAIIITTFSSHLARLKSIIEFSKKLNRKILFLGRSLARYVHAGEDMNIINFSSDVQIIKYRKKIKRILKKIQKNKSKYVLVVTGHQGEPKSTLSRMVYDKGTFIFDPEDFVIFSCKVIPTPTNIENRLVLETKLNELGVRIFRDVHVSGHAARYDMRDLINMVHPHHIFPSHGNIEMTASLASLAQEMGYKKDQIHVMRDGQFLKLI